MNGSQHENFFFKVRFFSLSHANMHRTQAENVMIERERERDEQEPYWDLLGTNSDEEHEK